jgi:hypothetical protein
MKKIKILFFMLLFLSKSLDLLSQSHNETRKEKRLHREAQMDSLASRLKLSKYADLSMIPTYKQHLLSGSEFPYDGLLLGIRDFLTEKAGLSIIQTDSDLKNIQSSNERDKIVRVSTQTGIFRQKVGVAGNYIFSFSMTFNDGKTFQFETKIATNGITDFRLLIFNTIDFNFPLER